MPDETDLKNITDKIKTPEGVTPETAAKVPDSDTQQGLSLYRRWFDWLKTVNFGQDINARKRYARRLYRLVVIWLVFMGSIILLQGFGGLGKYLPFKLDASVLIALITSTTATVIGLFVIVTRYFFDHDDRENPPDESV